MTTESMTMESVETPTATRGAVLQHLALAVLGSAAFGAASAMGSGVHAMVKGAWMAPALFVGGALLAMPPQYLFPALAGGRTTRNEVLTGTSRVLAAVATVLLGLAAPAAFFAATLHTVSGFALLLLTMVTLGGTGIFALTGARLAREETFGARGAALAWCVFALALGGRLMISLGNASGWL